MDASAALDERRPRQAGRVVRAARKALPSEGAVARARILAMVPAAGRGRALAWAALTCLSAAAPVAFVYATGVLVSRLFEAARADGSFGSDAGLLAALGAVGAIFLLQQSLAPWLAVVTATLGRRIDATLEDRAMAASVEPASLDHLLESAALDRLALVKGVGPGQHTAASALVGITGTVSRYLQTAGLLILISAYVWWLGPLVAAGLLTVRPAEVRRKLRSVQIVGGQSAQLRRADYFRELALAAPAAKEVRLFGLGEWIRERFTTDWRAAMEPVWATRGRDERRGVSALALLALVYTAAFTVLAERGLAGDLRPWEIVVVAMALLGAAELAIVGENEGRAEAGSLAIRDVVRLEEAARGALAAGRGAAPPGAPREAIRFEAVSFRYPGAEAPALEGLSLSIPAGRSVALVGPNGAGKTTAVKLLLRLHAPDSGRVLVDGADLRSYDVAWWRSRLAAIFQDFIRYKLTARDNVAFGAGGEEVSDTELEAAARQAGADEVVAGLPQGWDTVLSPEFSGGVDLSGGQWQRLALARALLAARRGARVLVLDEPSASLDVRAEAELFDRFLDLTRGMTTILVSHRFSTVRHVDLIHVIEHGRVVESGSHAELIAQHGRYFEMFTAQATLFADAERAETGASA